MFSYSSVVALFVVLSMGLVSQGCPEEVHYEADCKLKSWNGRPPGFKARLTSLGFNFVSSVAHRFIYDGISKIHIPSVHGKIPDKPLTYDVTSIRIGQYSMSSHGVNIYPVLGKIGYRVQVSVKLVSFTVIGNWHYLYSGFIRKEERGQFMARGKRINMGFPVKIGIDPAGYIILYVDNCGFQMSDFDIEFYDASKIVKKYKDKIVAAVKTSVSSQVCTKLREKMNGEVARKVKSMPMVVPIKDIVELDYSLVAAPTYNVTDMTNRSMETSHKGEVYPMNSREECPLNIPSIPEESDYMATHMLQMWITDYLPNSAGYALQNAGVLQYNVTPDNVPEAQKKYFNTSNFVFKHLFPQISKMYPSMLIQLNLNSTKAPECIIAPTGIQAVFVGDISSYAILPNQSLAYLFTLELTISADVNVSTKNNSLVWKIGEISPKISLVRSAVGEINLPLLEKEINLAIKLYFLKKLNEYGAKGIALPQVEGISLTNPVLTLGESYVKIETDLKYKR